MNPNCLGFTATDKSVFSHGSKRPWAGVGTELPQNATIEQITQLSGLNYDVLESPVFYDKRDVNGEKRIRVFQDKKALFRSDTGQALSVVSKENYKVVQPSDILKLFSDLSEIGGFSLETAGSLKAGKKIWALANIGHSVEVVDSDLVKPYLLLATSYDGTLATTCKFTAVRVSCNNTLVSALNRVANVNTGYLSDNIKINHSSIFNKDSVRQKLGIFKDSHEKFIINMRILANTPMRNEESKEFVKTLLAPTVASTTKKEIEELTSYKKIMSLFSGEAIGHGLTGGNNRWTMLNAITEYTDHHKTAKGKNPDENRVNSAFFGSSNILKTRAVELLNT